MKVRIYIGCVFHDVAIYTTTMIIFTHLLLFLNVCVYFSVSISERGGGMFPFLSVTLYFKINAFLLLTFYLTYILLLYPLLCGKVFHFGQQ